MLVCPILGLRFGACELLCGKAAAQQLNKPLRRTRENRPRTALRQQAPEICQAVIPLVPPRACVQTCQIYVAVSIALFRSQLVPFDGFLQVLRNDGAFFIQSCQVIFGARVTLFGCFPVPAKGLGRVFDDANSAFVH